MTNIYPAGAATQAIKRRTALTTRSSDQIDRNNRFLSLSREI